MQDFQSITQIPTEDLQTRGEIRAPYLKSAFGRAIDVFRNWKNAPPIGQLIDTAGQLLEELGRLPLSPAQAQELQTIAKIKHPQIKFYVALVFNYSIDGDVSDRIGRSREFTGVCATTNRYYYKVSDYFAWAGTLPIPQVPGKDRERSNCRVALTMSNGWTYETCGAPLREPIFGLPRRLRTLQTSKLRIGK